MDKPCLPAAAKVRHFRRETEIDGKGPQAGFSKKKDFINA